MCNIVCQTQVLQLPVRAEEQKFHEPTFEQGNEGKTQTSQRAASRHLLSENLHSDKYKIRARNYSFLKNHERLKWPFSNYSKGNSTILFFWQLCLKSVKCWFCDCCTSFFLWLREMFGTQTAPFISDGNGINNRYLTDSEPLTSLNQFHFCWYCSIFFLFLTE